MIEDWRSGGFGLYVHWPFCAAKCPYCDFNSHVVGHIDQHAWRDGYLAEIDRVAAQTPGRVLQSIFFGGGTPSLMNPDVVADVIARARQSWHAANDIEITLEANPTSVEAGRFSAYKQAGVNRVSLGIQALNDGDLRRLGRMHSANEAMRALAIAKDTFDRVSFDLIYARQDQTLNEWEAELKQALELDVDHLSLYQLTVEDGTVFGDRHARGLLKGLPKEALSAEMFELTRDMCDSYGMPAYEVSNHAKPGAESRHNMIYWRCGDYAGIGPGAHGRLTIKGERFATETHGAPGRWLNEVSKGQAETLFEPLSREAQAVEFLLMGLRLTEGVSTDRYIGLGGKDLPVRPTSELVKLGFLKQENGRLVVTFQGVIVLDSILSRLMID